MWKVPCDNFCYDVSLYKYNRLDKVLSETHFSNFICEKISQFFFHTKTTWEQVPLVTTCWQKWHQMLSGFVFVPVPLFADSTYEQAQTYLQFQAFSFT